MRVWKHILVVYICYVEVWMPQTTSVCIWPVLTNGILIRTALNKIINEIQCHVLLKIDILTWFLILICVDLLSPRDCCTTCKLYFCNQLKYNTLPLNIDLTGAKGKTWTTNIFFKLFFYFLRIFFNLWMYQKRTFFRLSILDPLDNWLM